MKRVGESLTTMVPFLAGDFGLPPYVQAIYAARGVTQLYKWQYQCLSDYDILEGCRNFIYSVPTGGGKSLVAEILLLRRLSLAKRKTKAVQIMILPCILNHMRNYDRWKRCVKPLVRVLRSILLLMQTKIIPQSKPYFGSQGPMPVPSGPLLCVCTIEKVCTEQANNIVNQMLEDNRLEELGLVVVDELHLIATNGRGAIMESALVKIHCANSLSRATPATHHVQIVGMSATIPNHEDLVTWLDAKCHVSVERAVPLHEHIKIEGGPVLFAKDNPNFGCFEEHSPGCSEPDVNELSFYISEEKSISTLIFCPTRKSTETLTLKLADYIDKRGKQEDEMLYAQRLAIVEELQAVQNIDNGLRTAIMRGVAYHHGGLTMDERKIVENGFKARLIQTLCATSTLAAGVNLPARRVILKGMKVGRDVLSSSSYRQMIGRAGRAGLDPYGETYLVVNKNQQELAMKLMNDPLEKCQSSLSKDQSGLMRLCLDLICCKLASTEEGLELCLSRSFLAVQLQGNTMRERQNRAIDYLRIKNFVERKKGNRELYELLPLCLGLATFKTSFTIEEAMMVEAQLLQAQDHLVLSDELHLVYLTAPITDLPDPEWSTYYRMFHQLSPCRLQVAKAVGLTEGYLAHKAIGKFRSAAPSKEVELTARRFWCALILRDAVHEMPLPCLAVKYKTTSGCVQSLMKSASYFAHSTVGFCSRMGWWALELIIGKYITRLGLGVRQEIIPLVELPHIGAARARMLYNAGYKTAEAIASAKPQKLILCARASLGPYPMHAASSIIRGAQAYLKKQAKEMKQSAEELLQAATTRP